MALITPSDVLPYLSATSTTIDGNDATLLLNLIEGVEQFVESYISSPLSLTLVTEYISGNEKPYILLKNIPTGSLSLYIDSNRDFNADTLIDPTAYEIKSLERRVELVDGTVFPSGSLNIKVVYETGWDATTLPKDLKMVICDIAANTFTHIRNKTESMATRGGMGTTATFISDKFILPQHYYILNIYRKPNL